MTCYLFTLDFIAENTTYPPRHGYVQLFLHNTMKEASLMIKFTITF